MPVRSRRKKSNSTNTGSTGGVRSRSAWYLILPLALLLAATAPWQRLAGNFFAPYLSINQKAGDLLADQTLKLRSRSELAEEVVQLRKQNLLQALELEKYRRLEDENRQLRAILKLQELPGYDYISCSVILRDPWMWEKAFTINSGSRDGLIPGLAVIAPAPDREGRVILLGIIESVSRHTSRVISVLNPEFRISASLPESEAVGFLNAGEFAPASSGTASVDFLPANRTFALNELIYTTGFEAAIPGGLCIGRLESIEPASLPFGNRLYRRGSMRPAGELERIRTVVVARLKNTTAGDKPGHE